MSEGISSSFDGPMRSAMNKSTKIPLGATEMDQEVPQAVTQPPLQQILRNQKLTSSKRKTRKSTQSAKPSVIHIEEAAGDVSDLSASLLLACLFCHFSDCLTLVPGTCSLGWRSFCSPVCLPEFSCSPACCTNIDCCFLDVCHHTAECLELAMEISELCFH